MQGWLFHWEGWPIKYWHRRWAELKGGLLHIYKSPSNEKPLYSVDAENFNKIAVSGKIQKNYRRFAFRLEADNLKPMHFASENKEEMENWLKFLHDVVEKQIHTQNGEVNSLLLIRKPRKSLVSENSIQLLTSKAVSYGSTPATFTYNTSSYFDKNVARYGGLLQ